MGSSKNYFPIGNSILRAQLKRQASKTNLTINHINHQLEIQRNL